MKWKSYLKLEKGKEKKNLFGISGGLLLKGLFYFIFIFIFIYFYFYDIYIFQILKYLNLNRKDCYYAKAIKYAGIYIQICKKVYDVDNLYLICKKLFTMPHQILHQEMVLTSAFEAYTDVISLSSFLF